MSVAGKRLGLTGVIGRILGSLFFLVFLGMGLVFCGLLGREVLQVARTYAWKKTECVILDSRVVEQREHGETPYRYAVKYQYSWQERDYTSEKCSRQDPAFADYGKAQRLATNFPVDTKAFCFVNPANPSESLLVREIPWMGLFMIIPLVFVAVGGGGIYGVWRGGRSTDPAGGGAQSPISSKMLQRPGCLVLFFFVFFAVGCGAFYAMAIRPALGVLAARSWRPARCTVVSSRVQSHSSDDGTTYSVDILYTYEFNGEQFKSSRYSFVGGSSSGYAGKAAVVNRHPPGRKTVCYVNPSDPNEAVLERGFTGGMWFGLLPLIFVGVGAGGMFFTARSASRKRDGARSSQAGFGRAPSASPWRGAPSSGHGPRVLKARWSRFAKFLGSIAVAAFWNGIVSVFVWQAVLAWRRGHPEWFLMIFLIPFVLVGLVMVGFVGHSFLALFNPTVKLRVNADTVPLGGTLEVSWEISGRMGGIEKLRIYLEGREEATYRRGTRSHTDKVVFATFDLARVTNRNDMRSGRARVTIPADTMHTFGSDHNKVLWTLYVHGDIPRWPDVKDEFPLTILPLPVGQTARR